MSTPQDTSKVHPLTAIQCAMSEIVSATSSLNMRPDPLPDDRIGNPEVDVYRLDRYISESDGNAKHAVEHQRAAFDLLRKASQAQEMLKRQVYRLAVQLREAGITPKTRTWLDDSETNDPQDPAKCSHPGCAGHITELVCSVCRSF